MRPPRVPGFSYVGLRRYFLTICVRGRRPVFISHETVSAVLAHFRQSAERLWQDGYYDRVLRDEDKLLSVVRYVLSNPVRAGLARAIGEYPFCGSDLYSMDEICACGEMWTPRQRRP